MTDQEHEPQPQEGLDGETEGLVPQEQAIDVGEDDIHREDISESPRYSEEAEREARDFGWKPRSEWLGQVPPGFVDDPAEYVRQKQATRTYQVMEDRLRKLEAMQTRAMQQQAEAHQRQLQEIQEQKRRAVDTADVKAYDQWTQREQELMRSAPQPAQQEPQIDPEFFTYAQSPEGQWVNNPMLREEARLYLNDHPGYWVLRGDEQAKVAKEFVAKKYPHLFPKEPQKRPQRQMVDQGGLGTQQSNEQYRKLPNHAKAQFKRFVEMGYFKDDKNGREQYAADYFNA